MTLRADDDGVTLVELIMYVVLSTIFVGLLAVMFAQGLGAQARSTERDRATGYANVVSASLGSVRNAVEVAATTDSVVARIVTADGGFRYRAWRIMPDGALRYRDSTTPISLDTSSGWGTLVPGGGSTADRVQGAFTYSAVGRTLTADLRFTAGRASVNWQNSITAQAVVEGASG